MNRQELMLAALAAGGKGMWYEPVQVQKLFFLIDTEIPGEIGGRKFAFRPYDYGPFDSDVYSELEQMARDELAAIAAGYYRQYGLTVRGYEQGKALLDAATPAARDYMTRAAKWVTSLSFSQLVSAIYQKYPDMKAASVFRTQ